MIRSAIVAAIVLLLGACATQPPDVVQNDQLSSTVTPVEAVSAGVAATEVVAAAADIKSVAASELESTLICKTRKRPGSRVTEKYCSWPEQHAQNQTDERQQVEYLRREHARTIAYQEQMETARRLGTQAILGR